MKSIAILSSLVLFLASGLSTAQQRGAEAANLGVENWFGPLEFSGERDVYAHLTSMRERGRAVAIKLSRSPNPTRLEISYELSGDSQNQPVQLIAGDAGGPIYIWTNLPNAIEDTCVANNQTLTVLKSPAADQQGQTIMVLSSQRRYSGNNNPC